MEKQIVKNPIVEQESRAALYTQLNERTAHLSKVAAALKNELFGIDDVIDQVIESVRAWYVLPEIITRPVIVCLWGLTGTGKTQLVRRLTQMLGFYDRFVEVQMDGFSNGANVYSSNSIAMMLAQAGIIEGTTAILALDEFQRFRTINNKGDELKLERYQDVWSLLSDGRLPPALSLLTRIETSLVEAAYEQDSDGDNEDEDEEEEKKKKKRLRKFKISPCEARELRRTLKLTEPLEQIMTWGAEQIHERMLVFRESPLSWETDYSKLLIFVCGNLDEMYSGIATSVEDCDTDADVFHELTRKLTVIDVKKALSERFKPEQIARLGNNHMIYPSLSHATYMQLIRTACARYLHEVHSSSGVRFAIDEAVHEQMYANGVFPSQGTRPLFSSIHAILSSTLVNAALWAIENGVTEHDTVQLSVLAGQAKLVAHLGNACKMFSVPLVLENIKRRASADFRALLAVHEAGHGLIYALLFGRAPREIKINLASYEGGYNSFTPRKAWSRQNLLDSICVTLAGRIAEELIFGSGHATNGAEGDLRKATAIAARFVRYQGFNQGLSRIDLSTDSDNPVNTSVRNTNEAIENLLTQGQTRALQLLRTHQAVLLTIVDALLLHGSLNAQAFSELMGLSLPVEDDEPLDAYAQRLEVFRSGVVQPASNRSEDSQAPAARSPRQSLANVAFSI